MKIKKIPLLFFVCLSLTTLSCDNGESDPAIGNLSEFAKEFVSTHINSSNSINMGNETPFTQVVHGLLNVFMLMMVVWFVDQIIQKRVRKKIYSNPVSLSLR